MHAAAWSFSSNVQPLVGYNVFDKAYYLLEYSMLWLSLRRKLSQRQLGDSNHYWRILVLIVILFS